MKNISSKATSVADSATIVAVNVTNVTRPKKSKKKIDMQIEDDLYFLSDKDEREILSELGLNQSYNYFD